MVDQYSAPDDVPPAGPQPGQPYGSPPATAYPEVPGGIEEDPDARTMAMLCHLTGLSSFIGIPGFVGPLVIWLLRKDQQAFVDDQGKEALNFQIAVLLAAVVISAVGMATCGIGFLLVPVLVVVVLVFCILAAVRANQGEYYRYPLNIRLIK
ncbi:MAG: DUF4870 domain-containing protein [Planctomycetales bacterium]|nr:DUF4870 domain-containing protein [Planctomycetales bacterium]